MIKEDDNKYWAYAYKNAGKTDLGHICKECKKPFTKLDEPMAIRRGGRIELKYHSDCFSGSGDPRTQKSSTYNTSKWAGTQQIHAPKGLYNKMRTGSHF